MEIQKFIDETAKGTIPLADLTTIAASRTAHGDDVLAAFRTQIEQRSAAAQKVLDQAQAANRDTLLASEQRQYDAAIRERDSILGLQRAVEQRTTQAAFVPATQVSTTTESRTEDVGPVLGKEHRCADWLQKRGNYQYAGEKGVESLRLGRFVRAMAFGDRRGFSPLEMRVLSEGTDSAGGFTVPEPVSANFFDRTRNAMVVSRAGAVIVPMTSDVLHIARLAQPTAASPDIALASWKTENDSIDETDLLLERVTFTARTLPVLLKMSVELQEDSLNIDQIIERELSQQLALELDRAALLGSGVAPEPTGVLNQAGVTVTSFGGAAVTNYDFIVESIGRIWANNHEPSGIIYNSSLATALAKLADQSGQPLQAPSVVTALPAFRTNQITNSGASPEDTTMFTADWTKLLVGLRTSFRLEVSRTAGTAFEKLQVWVRAYLRADIQVADPTAFDIVTDIG